MNSNLPNKKMYIFALAYYEISQIDKDMKRLLFLFFNVIVLLGFAAPTDTIPPMMPPLPPRYYEFAPQIHLSRNEHLELTNLVIFIRFADDSEFTETLEPIDQMFNDTTPYNISVYNYFDVMTYGKINYHTVYTNDIQNSVIVSYQDIYPRAYYQPYSEYNPNGDPPGDAELKLLGRVLKYVDSLNLVDPDVNLDGNNDGLIDNISFILKGNVGNWADLLWPHMGYFSAYYAGLPYWFTINGKVPSCYNFEFANSGSMFSANVFCHEMGHSLGIPDLYHYYSYNSIYPVYLWDMMGQNNLQQVSAIIKYKFLGIIDEPVEITQDGHYELNSLTSSDENNCYFIRSAIDPDQWYTIEYRNCDDFMDNVPHSGVVIGRWNDNVNMNDIYSAGNGGFDFYNKPHSYWVFRRNSNIDTVNGQVNQAAFGYSNRYAFGPGTNPHPYLVDGTPENSFEITNIHFSGDQASFDVHFFNVGVETHSMSNMDIYPNPTDGIVTVCGTAFTEVQLFDAYGKLLGSWPSDGETMQLDLSPYAAGVYIVKVLGPDGTTGVEKVVKK